MIPDAVQEKLTEDEIQNITNRNGWAIGTVALSEHGEITRRIEYAYIELFNGDGGAGLFGGVKFLAEDKNGEYEEAYAYATPEAFQRQNKNTGWYVESFTDPEHPRYGKPEP